MASSERKALSGLDIVVTRPAQQAENLCQKIESLDGRGIRFPTLEIKFESENPLTENGKTLRQFQKLVFVSRNAVDAAVKLWPDFQSDISELDIYAIGEATRDALYKLGVANVISASGSANSEQLLQHESLQAEALAGCSVLILRGHGGRELLAEELARRGALPEYANVYRRCKPCYDSSKTNEYWARLEQGKNHQSVIIVTSVETLKNLMDMLLPLYSEALLNSRLLVISERVAKAATEYGFKKPIWVAGATSDNGLMNTLLEKLNEETP